MGRSDVACQTETFADKFDVERFLISEYPTKNKILASEVSEAYFQMFGIRKFYEDFKRELKHSFNYKPVSINKVKYILRIR